MKLVFNDERIVNNFQLRIWLNVSQCVSVKKLLENMIECASGNRNTVFENYGMDELRIMLERILHNEVYLLVLDDMCSDGGKWEMLKDFLVGGANGSRIVVTTSNESVASLMGTTPTHLIDRLAYDDCLSLFFTKVFSQGQEEENPNLLTIGANIVEKCAGVPLSVSLLAGLLQKNLRDSYWRNIRDHYVWNSQQNGNVLPALKISYEKLPSHLKACLSYCSIFPKGCDIEIDKIIQLWMAQGLIQSSSPDKELEHLGQEYFNDLCLRSFFLDIEVNNPFFNSTSKMQNLVYDFVVSVAETDCSLVSSHTQNIFEDVKHVAFLDYEMSGKELPSSLLQHHSLRTIFFPVDGIGPNTTFADNCISRFMDLRTLDLSHSHFEMLPSSIGELKRLKYLDLSGNGSIQMLHSSICNMQSLQTLRLVHCNQLRELPKDMDKLISLRHLYITTKQESFPDKVVGCLSSLRSLSIYNCKSMISLSDELQHLTNLRTLSLMNCPKLTFLPSSMKYLEALETLKIIDCDELALFEWQDVEGLKMLRSLVIGGLPELDARDVQCFRNLQSLVIAGLPELVSLPRWLEGSASTLKNLRIARCQNIPALPEWLKNLKKLEKIEISECMKLTSLPEGMHCLNELKELKIETCPELSSTCRGNERSNIAHIPRVFVNGRLIQ
ncbi:hypothetical protein M9H77_04113 [Catharanthus roseus]|uniref:Uncharacterized protein n=1 Tax=Catharanthus roseus TaxID=4058 RepID=A0ACC0CDB6_CATRO|nr:hypothetical protein M9H77_04113 [Catharanthus roseus]